MARATLFLLVAAFATTSAAAQQKQNKAETTGPDIVVTGVTLKDAKAALAACIARKCPPDKDIDATLAVAETQFVAGDYAGARATMGKSLGRNRRYAKTYPVPVSDLLRANARIAAHLGETDSYRVGTISMLRTLRAGLPKGDPRIYGGEIEVADSFAKTGQIEAAVDLYRQVAKEAHAAALPRMEGFARLRVALLYSALSIRRFDAYGRAATEATDDLIREQNPEIAPFVQAAKLLRLTTAVKRGTPGAMEQLVAEYRQAGAGATAPVLLYAPKIQLRPLSGVEGAGGDPRNQVSSYDFDDQWIDVSFLIGADGKVTETEVLRQSPKYRGGWSKPILDAVGARRYAPLAPQTPELLRVERYTLTSEWQNETGSRIRVRSPIPRVEVVDLSRDPSPAPAPPATPASAPGDTSRG